MKEEAQKCEKFLRETPNMTRKGIQDKLQEMRQLIADHNYIIQMEAAINPKQVLQAESPLIKV